ncbi:O-antigen ligase family protein [Bacillus sp. CGMCC 1.60114]
MGLMGILMYILKIYAIRISFTPPFLHFYDAGKMLDYFGEIRFQSIFSHKTKYAYYCLIGIFILRINTCLSKKIRVLGILILTINIVLTNSIMSLIATIILLVSFINFKKINKYFRHIIFCIAVVAIIVSGIMVYNYTSDVRDLGSWGSRKIIWESAIEFFKGHPIGVIDNWYFYRLDNHFQGAHNVFLDELLDYGIVGGGLFLIIYFGIFYNLFKIDKRTLGLFLATTILFMVDNLLYYDIVPVFWLSYLVIKIISQNNNRLSGIGNR